MGSNEQELNGVARPRPAVKHFFTPEQLAAIPEFCSLEGEDLLDCTIHAKLIGRNGGPLAGWIWYVLELDPLTGIAFGYVDGVDQEFGDFDVTELYVLGSPSEPAVIRDETFTPTPLRSFIGAAKATGQP